MSSVNMPKAVPNAATLPGHQGPASQTVHPNPTASGNELLSSNCLAAAVECWLVALQTQNLPFLVWAKGHKRHIEAVLPWLSRWPAAPGWVQTEPRYPPRCLGALSGDYWQHKIKRGFQKQTVGDLYLILPLASQICMFWHSLQLYFWNPSGRHCIKPE